MAEDRAGSSQQQEREAPRIEFTGAETKKRRRERDEKTARPLQIELDLIANADGSSRVQIGDTQVLCSLRLLARGASDRIVHCEVESIPGSKEEGIEMSDFVVRAIQASILTDRLPKVRLSFCMIILRADGGEICACIAAASLAATMAGVESLALVVPVALCLREECFLVDPARSEEDDDHYTKSRIIFAFLGSSSRTTLISRSGPPCVLEQVRSAATVAREAAMQVHEDMATALKRRYK